MRQMLYDAIPSADLLVTLPPAEVGKALLKVVYANLQNGIVAPGAVIGHQALFERPPIGGSGHCYPLNNATQIELAAAEGFQWLLNAGLIMPAPEPNKAFIRLTRAGLLLLKDPSGFDQYVEASSFPKEFMHASIAEQVWPQMALGNLDTAVFIAFRAVEE